MDAKESRPLVQLILFLFSGPYAYFQIFILHKQKYSISNVDTSKSTPGLNIISAKSFL